MKKSLLAIWAVAALLLSSCAQDYSAEIEELQKNVKEISAKVESIQSSISDGAVVTSVTKSDNGIVIKMSDGKEYEIANGTPGSVVSINDSGNWAIDGKDTGLAARGDNGVNGDCYKPCTDQNSSNYGKWIKVDGTTGAETVTDSSWLASSGSASGLTAVWEDDVLMLFGVEGYEDDDYFEISFTSILRQFAVFPTNWSSTYGLPYVTSYYMITPTVITAAWFGNLNYPRLKEMNWQSGIESFGYSRSEYSGFGRWLFGIAYASYLGATSQTDSPEYDSHYDINSSDFLWQWYKEEHEMADPGQIYNGVMSLCDYMAEGLAAVENNDFLDAVPTTNIALTYRVIPMNASLDAYKFAILDHGINITKVTGENRDNAVKIVGKPKYNKKDELAIEAQTSFFKAMGDTPLEFVRKYIKYCRYNESDPEYKAINDYVNNGAVSWLDTLGLSQALMINLEASTNGRGSEAIVSDGCIVKMEPFEAYAYYKDSQCNYLPLAYTGAPNDPKNTKVMAVLGTDSIDLGSKVALRNPVLGNAADYGFDVQWEFAVANDYKDIVSVSSAGVITRGSAAVSSTTVVPVAVSAHVMTPSNGKYIVADEGYYFIAVE